MARGRARKRANALAALVAGGVPALALSLIRPADFKIWASAFAAGLLWANGFEYAYHRYLLHRPRGFFARGHLRHHASVGTPNEAEHLALGQAPIWIVALFAINGAPIIVLDLLFGAGVASPMLAAFTLYEITAEEFHWRFHVREWIPKWLISARAHHLQHHNRPDERFNVFLPIFDTLFRSRAIMRSSKLSPLSPPSASAIPDCPRIDSMDREVKEKSWVELYNAALLETERDRLAERIAAALKAISERLRECSEEHFTDGRLRTPGAEDEEPVE